MKSEAEARKCWCPFARVVCYDKNSDEFAAGVTVGMTAANTMSDGGRHPHSHCIASECMAWRFDNSPFPAEELILLAGVMPDGKMFDPDTRSGWQQVAIMVDGSCRWTRHEKRGCCGLAGEPK